MNIKSIFIKILFTNLVLVNYSYAQNSNQLSPIVIQSPNYTNSAPIVVNSNSASDQYLGGSPSLSSVSNNNEDNSYSGNKSNDNFPIQEKIKPISSLNDSDQKNNLNTNKPNVFSADKEIIGKTYYAIKVYVHEEDSASSNIVDTLKDYTAFNVVNKDSKSGWYQISSGGVTGFSFLPWQNFSSSPDQVNPVLLDKTSLNKTPSSLDSKINENISSMSSLSSMKTMTYMAPIVASNLPPINNVIPNSNKENFLSIPTELSPIFNIVSLLK
jgi:hypothetical protein